MTTIDVSIRSHVGLRRSSNQDTVGVSRLMTVGSPASLSLQFDTQEPVLLAVADGMGGHLGGEVASRLAVAELLNSQHSISSVRELGDKIHDINTGVFRESLLSPERSAMGTTINGLWISASETCAFNVGDSPTYELVDGYLIKRSVDDVSRRSGEEGGSLTQCLGGTRTPVTVEPHLHVAPTAPGRWLLCSDGLSSYVPRATVQTVIADLHAPPSTIADALLGAALDAGAPDNVSIIVADIRESS